jgi:hypothetical protein
MHRSLVLLAATALVACAGPSITVTRDDTIPMPGAATYYWGPPPEHVPDGQGIVAQSPVIQERIKTAINTELRNKGYRETDSTNASFMVRFAVGSKTTQTQVNANTSTGAGVASSNVCGGAACWSGWDYGWYGSQTTDVQGRQSGVVVDLVDRKSKTLAWRGIYAKEATGKVPTQEAVQEAVNKLFAKLPAAGSKQ